MALLKNKYEISLWEDLEDQNSKSFILLTAKPSDWDDPVTIYYQKSGNAYIEVNVDGSTHKRPEWSTNTYYDSTPRFVETKIGTIGSDSMTSQSRALEPCLTSNINGTNTFTFKMFYTYVDTQTGKRVENSWIPLLVNEARLKVHWKDRWYDFVLKNRVEDSGGKSVTFTCEDLFVNELSKTGFNLEFDTELENNQGTVFDLAEKTLEETDWTLVKPGSTPYPVIDGKGFVPEIIKQYIEEPVYMGTRIIDNESDYVLLFYSQVQSQTTKDLQLIYYDGSNYFPTDTNSLLVIKDKVERIILNSVTWGEEQGQTVVSFSGGKIRVPNTVSDKYRAERLVDSQQSVFDSKAGKYVLKYNDTSTNPYKLTYGFSKTDYDTSLMVTNLATWDAAGPSGWESRNESSVVWTMYPVFSKDVDVSTYNSEGYVRLNNGVTLINRGIGQHGNYLKEGIQAGTKYIVRFRAATGGKDYPTAPYNVKINSNDATIKIVYTDPRTGDDETYFITNNNSYNDGWQEYTITCRKSVSKKNLSKVNIKITRNVTPTLWITDLQCFKIVKDNNGHVIYPGDFAAQSRALIRYYYYYPEDNTEAKTLDDIEMVWVSDEPNNRFESILNSNNEKIRSINIKQSNRFNILQTLAETFQCWAKFGIVHDPDTGAIEVDNQTGLLKKYVTFVNSIGEDKGYGFVYGIDLRTIQRTVQSNQLVTKTIVQPNSNEFGTNGFCTIARATDNIPKTNFILNLDYYVANGLLNGNVLAKDLYSTANDDLGYYIRLQRLNQAYDASLDLYTKLKAELTEQESLLQVYTDAVQSTQNELNQIENNLRSLANGATTIEAALTYFKTKSNDQVSAWINDRSQQKNALINYEKIKADLVKSIDGDGTAQYPGLKNRIEQIENENKEYVKQIEDLDKAFNTKYARYVQEGTWISEDYMDDNLYYLDGLSVAYTASRPQVQYNISVLRLTALEEFKNKVFDVGDIGFIEDKEFFGYEYINSIRTPIKEQIVVSQMATYFDSPEKDTITIQNYKTQFEDLFQRITSQTQSLQFAQGSYAKAAAIIDSTGTIKADLLESSLQQNLNILTSATNQLVSVADSGVTIVNENDRNYMMRLTSSGIIFTVDGGLTWTTGIDATGVRSNYLKSGVLNTNNVIIGPVDAPTFKWDSDGITAYAWVEDQSVKTVDPAQFVRFDQYGFYGIKDKDNFNAEGYYVQIDTTIPDNDWDEATQAGRVFYELINGTYYQLEDKPSDWGEPNVFYYEKVGEGITAIEDNAYFGFTWDGFFLKGDGDWISITSENGFEIFNPDWKFTAQTTSPAYSRRYDPSGNAYTTDDLIPVVSLGRYYDEYSDVLRGENGRAYGLRLRDKEGYVTLTTDNNGELWSRRTIRINNDDTKKVFIINPGGKTIRELLTEYSNGYLANYVNSVQQGADGTYLIVNGTPAAWRYNPFNPLYAYKQDENDINHYVKINSEPEDWVPSFDTDCYYATWEPTVSIWDEVKTSLFTSDGETFTRLNMDAQYDATETYYNYNPESAPYFLLQEVSIEDEDLLTLFNSWNGTSYESLNSIVTQSIVAINDSDISEDVVGLNGTSLNVAQLKNIAPIFANIGQMDSLILSEGETSNPMTLGDLLSEYSMSIDSFRAINTDVDNIGIEDYLIGPKTYYFYSDTIDISNWAVRIWAGSDDTFGNAKFLVFKNGYVYAQQGYFEGEIRAREGIFSGKVTIGTGEAHGIDGSENAKYVIWSGKSTSDNIDSYKFYVDNEGKLYAQDVNIGGIISVDSGILKEIFLKEDGTSGLSDGEVSMWINANESAGYTLLEDETAPEDWTVYTTPDGEHYYNKYYQKDNDVYVPVSRGTTYQKDSFYEYIPSNIDRTTGTYYLTNKGQLYTSDIFLRGTLSIDPLVEPIYYGGIDYYIYTYDQQLDEWRYELINQPPVGEIVEDNVYINYQMVHTELNEVFIQNTYYNLTNQGYFQLIQNSGDFNPSTAYKKSYLCSKLEAAETYASDTYCKFNSDLKIYELLTSEPADWATNWNNYYKINYILIYKNAYAHGVNNERKDWVFWANAQYDNNNLPTDLVSNFYVDSDGDLYAKNLTLGSTLNASNVQLGGTLRVGNITISSIDGGYIRNQDNWYITGEGDANFRNAIIRGTLRTVTFEKDNISAVGGKLLISPTNFLQEKLIGEPQNIHHISSQTTPPFSSDKYFTKDLEDNYILLTEEPEDWSTNYTDYYEADGFLYTLNDEFGMEWDSVTVFMLEFAEGEENKIQGISLTDRQFNLSSKASIPAGTIFISTDTSTASIELVSSDVLGNNDRESGPYIKLQGAPQFEILEYSDDLNWEYTYSTYYQLENEKYIHVKPAYQSLSTEPSAPAWMSLTYYRYDQQTGEYILVEEEPVNWATVYVNYFRQVAPIWQDNTYYYKTQNITILGNLDYFFGERIYNTSFDNIINAGTGLYANNVYLEGRFYLPQAGMTDETIGTTPQEQGQSVRIWAGSDADNRATAPFRVTQDGSIYASKGIFSGTINATDSTFQGWIKTAGILVSDDPNTKEQQEDSFYVAYDNRPLDANGNPINTGFPSNEDKILEINGLGLSIWEGGFRVFSDLATNYPYKYDITENIKQLPYVTVIDDQVDYRLLTTNLHITKAGFSTTSQPFYRKGISFSDGEIHFEYNTAFSEKDLQEKDLWDSIVYKILYEDGCIKIQNNEAINSIFIGQLDDSFEWAPSGKLDIGITGSLNVNYRTRLRDEVVIGSGINSENGSQVLIREYNQIDGIEGYKHVVPETYPPSYSGAEINSMWRFDENVDLEDGERQEWETNTTDMTVLGINNYSFNKLIFNYDQDNGISYKVHEITDLTGTIWLINETFDNSMFDTNKIFDINFECHDADVSDTFKNCRQITVRTDNMVRLVNTVGDGSTFPNFSQARSRYRLWYISNGTDITNQNLIDWLQENAILVPSEYYYAYYLDDSGETPQWEWADNGNSRVVTIRDINPDLNLINWLETKAVCIPLWEVDKYYEFDEEYGQFNLLITKPNDWELNFEKYYEYGQIGTERNAEYSGFDFFVD